MFPVRKTKNRWYRSAKFLNVGVKCDREIDILNHGEQQLFGACDSFVYRQALRSNLVMLYRARTLLLSAIVRNDKVAGLGSSDWQQISVQKFESGIWIFSLVQQVKFQPRRRQFYFQLDAR